MTPTMIQFVEYVNFSFCTSYHKANDLVVHSGKRTPQASSTPRRSHPTLPPVGRKHQVRRRDVLKTSPLSLPLQPDVSTHMLARCRRAHCDAIANRLQHDCRHQPLPPIALSQVPPVGTMRRHHRQQRRRSQRPLLRRVLQGEARQLLRFFRRDLPQGRCPRRRIRCNDTRTSIRKP